MKAKTKKNLTKILSFLMVFCMMVGIITPLISVTSVTASAAAPASYTNISTNSSASVSITSSGGAKYFKFVPTQSGTYKFYSTNYSADPYGALLDASGSILKSDDDSGDDYNFSITYDCVANTTYYIKAYFYNSAGTGSYTLNVQTVSILCDHSYDAGTVIAPTCVARGYTVYTCTLCSSTYNDSYTDMVSHQYVNDVCTMCGHSALDNDEYFAVKQAGGTAYTVFASGRTGSGYLYNSSYNYNENSLTNGGYDLYSRYNDSNMRNITLGRSFEIFFEINELAELAVNAYDIDESDGEKDRIYLVDETAGTRVAIGLLSGMNQSWNNTSFRIDSSYFIVGHTYHFELTHEVLGWVSYVRNVTLTVNGEDSDDDIIVPIESASAEASIDRNNRVTVSATAKAPDGATEKNYIIEIKATALSTMAQHGELLNASMTVSPTESTQTYTFNLESGAPEGTYSIEVFWKDPDTGAIVKSTLTTASTIGKVAVAYHPNGGSNNIPLDSTSYIEGDMVTVLFDYIPSRAGYNFLGWATSSTATTPNYTENGTKTFTIGSSDVTLYAVWELAICEHVWTESSRTDATCTEDGSVVYTCSCGESYTETIEATGHSYYNTSITPATCTEYGSVVYTCSCGDSCTEILEPTGHSYNTITTPATCIEYGSIVYTCHCGDSYTELIEAPIGHDYQVVTTVEPTCTTDGYIDYACANSCGATEHQVLPMLGHDYYTSTTVSTCTEYGSVVYTCACGDSYTELLEPTGHNYQAVTTVGPTCTTDGYVDYICANGCGATKHQVIPMLGHDFVNGICYRCGYVVNPHTHEYTVTNIVEATCTNMGYTEYTCSCGHSYRDDYVEPIRHDWDGGVITTEKTCTDGGLKTYTCQSCSATKTEILPAGHEWNETVTVEKTCTTDGSITKICTACGAEETEIVPAGHNWNEGVVTLDPTCTTEGYKNCTCLDCGISAELVIAKLGHEFVNGVCIRCGIPFIDVVTDSEHPIYGMYFEIDDILSDYGPSLIDEYGLMLDYNSDANLSKVAVYLTQDGTMWRRCIAVKGTGITYATYVPYLSYQSDIKYTGLNHNWINTFHLSPNSDNIWCYSNYTTIGVNLEDAYGNLLLSLYDIGQAGAETKIFDDLDEMIAWLKDDGGHVHEASDWIVDVEPTCVQGRHHKECTLCGAVLEVELTAPTDDHSYGEWIVDVQPTATSSGLRHRICTVCGAEEKETMPVLATISIEKVEAREGSTVTITIDIHNNPGIIGAILTIEFDSALTLIKAEAGAAWNTLNLTKPAEFVNNCNFVWDGVSNADYSNGTIITLTFEVPEGAEVDTVYDIKASYTHGNMINADLEAVDVEIENGSITVITPIGDVNSDGVVDVLDVLVLRRYLAGGYGVTIDEEAADIDKDGNITVTDLVLLRIMLVG